MVKRGASLALMLATLVGGGSVDPGMPVPVENQTPIFLKVLSFDRRLTDRKGKELVFGILYQSGYRHSNAVKERIVELVPQHASNGPPGRAIRVVVVDSDQGESLVDRLRSLGIEVLYVTPLRALDISAVTRAARGAGILTLSGVPDYVEAGISVGLRLRQDRPEILVNLTAAQAEGADLAAPLLKMVTVLKPAPVLKPARAPEPAEASPR